MTTTKPNLMKKVSAKIQFPKSICIGDPIYFEYGDTKYTYNKSFRGKNNWLGEIQLVQEENFYEYEGTEHSFIDYSIKVCYAPNEKLLDLYKSDNVLKSHKLKRTIIGVDTACYILEVGNNGDKIRTGGDGRWGDVTEVYNGNKLEGIIIELGLGDLYDFDDFKSKIDYIFNCKLG